MKFLLTIAFLLASFAPASFGAWGCESAPGVTLTQDIYWNSLPPALRAFRNYNELEKAAHSTEVAALGYKLDVPIQVWGWDPVCIMLVRYGQGFTWVPSALEPPVYVGPGLSFPGLPSYDPKTPSPRGIKVSIDAKDYPAFDPPQPPPSTFPVVGQCFNGWCGVGPGGLGSIDGQVYVQGGVRYLAHVSIGLAGKTVYFTIAPVALLFEGPTPGCGPDNCGSVPGRPIPRPFPPNPCPPSCQDCCSRIASGPIEDPIIIWLPGTVV